MESTGLSTLRLRTAQKAWLAVVAAPALAIGVAGTARKWNEGGSTTLLVIGAVCALLAILGRLPQTVEIGNSKVTFGEGAETIKEAVEKLPAPEREQIEAALASMTQDYVDEWRARQQLQLLIQEASHLLQQLMPTVGRNLPETERVEWIKAMARLDQRLMKEFGPRRGAMLGEDDPGGTSA